jgi:hypothetical protein
LRRHDGVLSYQLGIVEYISIDTNNLTVEIANMAIWLPEGQYHGIK